MDEVVISVSGYEQKILDTAASVNVVTSSQIHNGQAEDNLSEPLNRVPGIFALNRQNYAQDLQISSRGFGANSTFGTRGIRLYVDNIPVNVIVSVNEKLLPDGQPKFLHLQILHAPDAFEQPHGRRRLRRPGRMARLGSHPGPDSLHHPHHLHRLLRRDRLSDPLDHHAPEILMGL